MPLITENEMDYLVCARHDEWGNDRDEIRPIHGHIRKGVSKALQDRRYREWADIQRRPREGELVRENPGKIKEIIREAWKEPTTGKIQALLLVLNQADFSWPRKPCEKCMTGELDTVEHMLECPSNADIINDLMEKNAKVMEVGWDITEDETGTKTAQPDTTNPIVKAVDETVETLSADKQNRGNKMDIELVRKMARMIENTERRNNKPNTKPEKWVEKEPKKERPPQETKRLTQLPKRDKGKRWRWWEKEEKEEEKKYEEGDDIALIAHEEENAFMETVYIARIIRKNRNSLRVVWYDEKQKRNELRGWGKPKDGRKKGKWWMETEQQVTIHNLNSILTKVQWTERSESRQDRTHSDRANILDTPNKYMNHEEWERIGKQATKAIKSKSWENKKRSTDRKKRKRHKQEETTGEKKKNKKDKKKERTSKNRGYIYGDETHFAPVILGEKNGENPHRGLKARIHIPRGTTLTKIPGKIYITRKTNVDRIRDEKIHILKTYEEDYKILVEDEEPEKGKGVGHLAKFDHNRNNTNAQIITSELMAYITSTRNIQPGEEIIVEVNTETEKEKVEQIDRGEKKTKNKHGGHKARKIITAMKWRKKLKLKVVNTGNEIRRTEDPETRHKEETYRSGKGTTKRKERKIQRLEDERQEDRSDESAPEAQDTKDNKNDEETKETGNQRINKDLREWTNEEKLTVEDMITNQSYYRNMRIGDGEEFWMSNIQIMEYLEIIQELTGEETKTKTWLPDIYLWQTIKKGEITREQIQRWLEKSSCGEKIAQDKGAVELQDVDLIIIPMRLPSHFVMGEINMRNRTVTIRDSGETFSNQEKREELAKTLAKAFLAQGDKKEWERILKHWETTYFKTKVTQQQDGSSCGVMMCASVMKRALNIGEEILPLDTQEETDDFKLRLIWDMLTEHIDLTRPRKKRKTTNKTPKKQTRNKKKTQRLS